VTEELKIELGTIKFCILLVAGLVIAHVWVAGESHRELKLKVEALEKVAEQSK
jgi:hypothetical protein